MRPRIKKESLTPSSVKVFSTFTSPEEQKVLKERRDIMREHDALVRTNKPKHYYVRIFGKEIELSLEEIKKCNFKYYTK
jgi:hypothetical protein